ncbi:hypothetical protein EVAR_78635_1 [Eumeta japonica]|uniref:Uncharacterized protein n=1 Tax=Eumeta variegata TaxID=151549 RepID=A0A4C1U7Z7_EUMVA|nr:hypothetical protein EVAR_78635_1 [Eumeta japonica]
MVPVLESGGLGKIYSLRCLYSREGGARPQREGLLSVEGANAPGAAGERASAPEAPTQGYEKDAMRFWSVGVRHNLVGHTRVSDIHEDFHMKKEKRAKPIR